MTAISIVSFNTSLLLEKVLRNIFTQKGIKNFEVWVEDNNSSDDSVQMVKKKFPQVKLVQSNTNLGFAAGQNLNLKHITSDFVFILNPDTEFAEDLFFKMTDFMEHNPSIGIVSCKIIDKDGHLVSNGGDLPTGLPLLSWLFNLDFLGIPNFHRKDEKFYMSKNAGWVGGTFMLVRREVFDKIGFLNEDYFMYFEDVDFCSRALKNGFKIGLNPEAQIIHQSGASSKNPKFAQWLGEFKGLSIFSFKNFGFIYGLLINFLVRLAIIIRIMAFGIAGKLDYSKIYLKILFEF